MTALLAAPILLTLTLLVSGLAKLGARQGTVDAMTSLRLPLRSTHRAVASALPAAEILLALALWLPFVPLQVVVASLIAVLLVAYLAIIARALTFAQTVECSCFGTLASPTVSMTTLGRNIILVGLGLMTVLAAATGLLTRTLVQSPLSVMGLGAVLLAAVVLTALTLGAAQPTAAGTGAAADGSDAAGGGLGGAGEAGDVGGSIADDDEEILDYEREPIPGAVLQQPSGRLTTLRQLTAHRAALLVFLSEGCGPCERVLDHAERWIDELDPYLQVLFVFGVPLDHRRERTIARVGDHALHDLQFTARSALGATTSPSAVLLGADGLLAGGPVRGGTEVIEFVTEIQEQLQVAEQSGELAAPAENPSTSTTGTPG